MPINFDHHTKEEEKKFEEQKALYLMQCKILDNYLELLKNRVAACRLSAEEHGSIKFDERVQLRGVNEEYNLMYDNFFKPLVVNEVIPPPKRSELEL